jgi:endonuclease YncB( thermonuclease family)
MSIGQKDKLRAIVWLGSRNINHEMLAEGWGWAKLKHLSPDDSAEYVNHADAAKAKRLGLWQQPNPQPPWEFRMVEKLRMLLDAI